MKAHLFATLAVLSIAATGCVATTFSRTVEVTKDADGKIIQTKEIETITQPSTTADLVQPSLMKVELHHR